MTRHPPRSVAGDDRAASFHFVALEFPGALPDGSPNGTQRLIDLVGEREEAP